MPLVTVGRAGGSVRVGELAGGVAGREGASIAAIATFGAGELPFQIPGCLLARFDGSPTAREVGVAAHASSSVGVGFFGVECSGCCRTAAVVAAQHGNLVRKMVDASVRHAVVEVAAGVRVASLAEHPRDCLAFGIVAWHGALQVDRHNTVKERVV